MALVALVEVVESEEEVVPSLLVVSGRDSVEVVLAWLDVFTLVVVVTAVIAAVVLSEVDVVVEASVDREVVSGLTGAMGGPRFVDASTSAPECATTK